MNGPRESWATVSPLSPAVPLSDNLYLLTVWLGDSRELNLVFFLLSARYLTLGLSLAAYCHPWKRKVSLFSEILLNVNGPRESWATVSTPSLAVPASLKNFILMRCPFSETLLNVNGSRESLSGSRVKNTRTSIPKSNPKREEGLLSVWLGPGWGGRASTLIINCGSREERWIIWPDYLKITRTSSPKSNPQREEGLLSVWLEPGRGGRASTLTINCGSREERLWLKIIDI